LSRIGKLPVIVPPEVQVEINGSRVMVKGSKGTMDFEFSPLVEIKREDNKIIVNRTSEDKPVRALHGTTRALIQNMVTGVNEGFKKVLQIQGVGYKAEKSGNDIIINVGFSHSVTVKPPEGIIFEVDEKAKLISISGYDKQVVGQVAADIRKIRPPEPYKGKGIRYLGEHVRSKPGKSAKVGLM